MLNLLVALALTVAIPPEAPFQDLSFDGALAAAKKDGKVVMIDFFTTWCQPCKRLDRITWGDETVRKWLGERTVPLKMDAEKEVELAQRFGVDRYPTIAFVRPDGTRIDAITGFKEPAEFLRLANALLVGVNVPAQATPPPSAPPVDGSEELKKREAHGNELAKAGQYEEALAEYMWCFDHRNEGAPGKARTVRLSTILGEIQTLAKKHPPARQALEDRRKSLEFTVIAGTDPATNVPDMAVLNRTLGTPDRTLAVYDLLKKGNRTSPAVMVPLVKEIAPLLVDARRYADLVADAGDIEERVRAEIESVRSAEATPPPADEGSAKALERSRAMFASMKAGELGVWYEALLGAGKPEAAAKVADRILEFAPTGAAYAALVDRALHAEAPAAARALVERGRSTLPESERSYVEGAAKKIPAPK